MFTNVYLVDAKQRYYKWEQFYRGKGTRSTENFFDEIVQNFRFIK